MRVRSTSDGIEKRVSTVPLDLIESEKRKVQKLVRRQLVMVGWKGEHRIERSPIQERQKRVETRKARKVKMWNSIRETEWRN
jgi:hypothetical protein